MNTSNSNTHKFADILCNISDSEDMQAVLRSILTYKELQEIENRLRIFQLLSIGISHREISKLVGVGVSTVTRGATAFREEHSIVLKKFLDDISNRPIEP